MNVSELYKLTIWIEEEIEKKNIPNKYQKLYNILNQNTQPNQQNQPFETQKNDLIQTLEQVPLA